MAPREKADGASGKAIALVREILDRGLEGVPPLISSEALAAEYSADGSYATTRQRIAALIRWEATKNFATGFATGVGGLATLPVAIPAALLASWALQARLAGAIAALHGHSIKEDRVRSLVLLAILGDAAKDVVKEVGVKVGTRLTANAIKAVPGRVLFQINRLVGMRLLTKAGQRSVVSLAKAIPFAGGVVGGSFDAAGCVAVGKVADGLFAPEQLKERKAKVGRAASRARRRPGPTPPKRASRSRSLAAKTRATARHK
jgi:uncharacterized protein (DUF697 family)